MNFQDQDNTSIAIEAQGLTKLFGDVRAVDGLDLHVPAGTVFSLLGPNGSGKTTTVRMLATLLKPDGGTAKVNGYDVVHQGAEGPRDDLTHRPVRRARSQPHRAGRTCS